MSRTRLIVVLLIISLALFSSWILKSLDQIPLLRKPVARHEPDYFLTGFNSTVYDADGKRQYHLRGQRLEHYPDDNSVQIQQPQMTLYSARETWELTADRGIFHEQKKKLQLVGQVKAYNVNVKAGNRLAIQTQNLDLYTEQKYAETRQPVKIEHGTDVISATGMQLHLDDGRINFVSDVQGTYEIFSN